MQTEFEFSGDGTERRSTLEPFPVASDPAVDFMVKAVSDPAIAAEVASDAPLRGNETPGELWSRRPATCAAVMADLAAQPPLATLPPPRSTDRIKVRKADVAEVLRRSFPGYRGRKFSLVPSGRVTFHDLNWSGGTRNEYCAVGLDGFVSVSLPDRAPWNNPAEGVTIEIPSGVVVVEHSEFCGHDLGIRIYCNRDNVVKMLESGGARG